MIKAKKDYKRNRNSYKEVFETRKNLLDNRTPYWNTVWDRLFHVVAVRNTQRAEKDGWKFPTKNEKHTSKEV